MYFLQGIVKLFADYITRWETWAPDNEKAANPGLHCFYNDCPLTYN